MSKDEHTKGRLIVSGDELLNEDAGRIGEVSDFDGWRDLPLGMAKANARRLAASWNACKGIETETLESRAVEPCDICGAASHNLRANRAEARADTATALLTEARDFIRDEYDVKLDSACLKDESGQPRRDTLDPRAVEDVEAHEAILAKLDEALK